VKIKYNLHTVVADQKFKEKKNLVQLKFFKKLFDQKLQFTYPCAPQETSKLQEKPSAIKREHPAL
jgi:hypothetical protein